MITIFKDLNNTSTPFFRDVDKVIERIKTGTSKDLILSIRSEKDKSKRNDIKKKLPAICFSGKFSKRNDSSIIEHSGYICLDFDDFETTEKYKEVRNVLEKDKYTYCLFESPSGNGLKVIVKIPKDIDKHKQYFSALQDYYSIDNFDVTSKNLSRVCFESYDEDIFVNENSEIWEDYSDNEFFDVSEKIPDVKLTQTNEIIDRVWTWFDSKYKIATGQRSHNTYILASALNRFGVPKVESVNFCRQFIEKDFNEKEVLKIIESAYSNYNEFNTQFFEDTKTINYVKNDLKKGLTEEEIIKKYDYKGEENVKKALETAHKEKTISIFWYKDKKGVHIVNHLYKQWLEQSGFYKFYPENSESFIFVKKVNNLVEDTNENKLKDFVLDHLYKLDDIDVYEYISGRSSYFKEDYLNFLENVDVNFKKDTRYKAYIYFKNCAVEISKNEIKEIDYLNIDGYVWQKHIINREFEKSNILENDYSKLVYNISGKSEDKEKSIKSTIGYLLHSFKTSANNKAVILNDETISENPNGGTGKGLFINAISKLKRVVTIDGKTFSFEKSFPYQTVSADTQILVFDDVKKNFNFELLFSLITEGITLEKKNKDAIKLPIEKSPKILISTNYAIGGNGNSFERRKWELEFCQHYKPNYTPLDEFGRMLFTDWSSEDWLAFDNYMISCVQLYLEQGLIESEFNNLEIRKIIAKTSFEFYEWVLDNSIALNTRHTKSELYNRFIEDYQDYKKWLSQKRFTQWVETYGTWKKYKVNSGNTNGIRWIEYEDKDQKEVFDEIEEIPF